ncbi:MAG: hypothetical protein J7M38_00655 [Armatimonadetes bacterium]|nr:hypothetical protein [Armatimonadota bacterium]
MIGQKTLITGYLVVELKDRLGRSLRRDVRDFDPFVRNLIVILENILKGVDTYVSEKIMPITLSNATDVEGNSFTPMPYSSYNPEWTHQYWNIVADAGDVMLQRGEPTDWGILVGYGESETTINFWSLENPYPHGRGAGYMNYLSTEVTPPEFDGSYVKFTVKRRIVNDAEATQRVSEVGVVGREMYTWRRVLIARDLLSPPIDMPPASILEVTIVIQALLAPFNIYTAFDYAIPYDQSVKHTL